MSEELPAPKPAHSKSEYKRRVAQGDRTVVVPPPRVWPSTPKAGTLEGTRHYMHAFIASLKDCGHSPEHVRQVMSELLGGAAIRKGETP